MYCKRRKSGARFPDRKARNRLYACHCIVGNCEIKVHFWFVPYSHQLPYCDQFHGWRPVDLWPKDCVVYSAWSQFPCWVRHDRLHHFVSLGLQRTPSRAHYHDSCDGKASMTDNIHSTSPACKKHKQLLKIKKTHVKSGFAITSKLFCIKQLRTKWRGERRKRRKQRDISRHQSTCVQTVKARAKPR